MRVFAGVFLQSPDNLIGAFQYFVLGWLKTALRLGLQLFQERRHLGMLLRRELLQLIKHVPHKATLERAAQQSREQQAVAGRATVFPEVLFNQMQTFFQNSVGSQVKAGTAGALLAVDQVAGLVGFRQLFEDGVQGLCEVGALGRFESVAVGPLRFNQPGQFGVTPVELWVADHVQGFDGEQGDDV